MAFGHQNARANFTPSSFVSPNFPFRILYPTNASQCPLSGYPLKLHGQPYVQLQLWMYSVSKPHFVAMTSPLAEARIHRRLFNVFSCALHARPGRDLKGKGTSYPGGRSSAPRAREGLE